MATASVTESDKPGILCIGISFFVLDNLPKSFTVAWLVDSGASAHICIDVKLFSTYTNFHTPLSLYQANKELELLVLDLFAWALISLFIMCFIYLNFMSTLYLLVPCFTLNNLMFSFLIIIALSRIVLSRRWLEDVAWFVASFHLHLALLHTLHLL